MQEIWKDIKDYETFYEVSNFGQVRNVKTKLILKPALSKKGYLQVHLCKNSKVKVFYIHRLVAQTFIFNQQNKKQVNHINGIKTDNRDKNLEWVTCSENIMHSYKKGLQPIVWDNQLKIKIAKKHYKKVKNIEQNIVYESITKASKECNINVSTLSNCLRGKTKTAGGYHWKYESEY